MTMSMIEIDRTLRALRLSGIRATLDTRILQAQATGQPFLETFSLVLQDELDRRRSRLTERRYLKSGLDERATLNDFDWRFNPKLPRQACFELHTLKFITEAGNAMIIGKPGTGKSHIAKRLPTRPRCRATTCATWRPTAHSPTTAWPTSTSRANCCASCSNPTCSYSTICFWPGAFSASALDPFAFNISNNAKQGLHMSGWRARSSRYWMG